MGGAIVIVEKIEGGRAVVGGVVQDNKHEDNKQNNQRSSVWKVPGTGTVPVPGNFVFILFSREFTSHFDFEYFALSTLNSQLLELEALI